MSGQKRKKNVSYDKSRFLAVWVTKWTFWAHFAFSNFKSSRKQSGLRFAISSVKMGLNKHFHGEPKNVKIIFQPVNVGPAQTGFQNCYLGIIQHGKLTFLCWIIPKSQFCKPVWAGPTLTDFVWICGYSIRQAIRQLITRVILEKSQRSWWTKIVLHEMAS